ncbi:BnaA06g10870D [Brassica napus]|uniref:(rape) hypothetical protein n=1 Tax=Brassica napus TaxID=3708 RepID=A0A078HBE0_BRANA|nr:unnamed protein product [Brassica napus]CDY35077.1 BnaA06g10870D [Brassica napus]
MIGRILLLLTDIEMRDETFWGLLRPVAAKRRRLLYFILNRLAEDPYGVFELADSSRLWVPV